MKTTFSPMAIAASTIDFAKPAVIMLDDIPADMNRRYGIYMLSLGVTPSLERSLEMIRKLGSVDYQIWIGTMKQSCQDAGFDAVRRGEIVDHLRFDAWCLTYVLMAKTPETE